MSVLKEPQRLCPLPSPVLCRTGSLWDRDPVSWGANLRPTLGRDSQTFSAGLVEAKHPLYSQSIYPRTKTKITAFARIHGREE